MFDSFFLDFLISSHYYFISIKSSYEKKNKSVITRDDGNQECLICSHIAALTIVFYFIQLDHEFFNSFCYYHNDKPILILLVWFSFWMKKFKFVKIKSVKLELHFDEHFLFFYFTTFAKKRICKLKWLSKRNENNK